MNRPPAHRRQPASWVQRAAVWPVRSLKILLIGITTCGLGWFWLAFYVYVEWRRKQQSEKIQRPREKNSGANWN